MKKIFLILALVYSTGIGFGQTDNPCGATVLTVAATCTYAAGNFPASLTATAGVPAPTCSSYPAGSDDSWYQFTVPASGAVTIDLNTGTLTDMGMAWYSGACGALTQIACDDDSSPNGLMPMISMGSLTPGATIWVRLWEYGGNANGNFTICAYDPSDPSQDCAGAIPVCNDATFAGNSGGFLNQELSGPQQGCLTGEENQTTWFGFSPQLTGTIQLTITPTAGAIDYDFAIWGPFPAGTGCPITSTPTRCSFAAATGPTGLQTGAGDQTEGAGGDRWVDPLVIGVGQIGMVYYLVVDNFTANTTPFTLDWTLSTPGMLDCTPPLPVELVNFEAYPDHKINHVHWITQVEINSDYFIVERSSDGINYEEFGRVKAGGNSNILLEYAYTDTDPFPTTYYQLRQVDLNGAFKNYGPIVINNEEAQGISLRNIYPNPADHSFYLDMYSKDPIPADVFVYDSYGKMVYSKLIGINGMTTYEIPCSQWASGIYVVKVINEAVGLNQVRRVVIN